LSSDIQAAVYAVSRTLNGDAIWEDRIHFGYIPPSMNYPYVWIVFQGGGDQQNDLKSDPLITLAVTASTDNQTDAFEAQARIAHMLDDRGLHDRFGGIAGLDGWTIRTISKSVAIYIEDPIDKAERIYRAGNQYIFDMEAT